MTAHASPNTFIEAEQALLGAAIIAPSTIDKVRGLVAPEDFGEPVHRMLFEAMCAKRDEGASFDVKLLRLAIQDQDLGGVSVGEYIARLASAATTVNMAGNYATEVRMAADLRRLTTVTADAAAYAKVPGANPREIATAVIEDLDAIVASAPGAAAPCLGAGEAADQVLAEIERLRSGGKRDGAAYGIATLDKMTLGMKPGELIIAAGRPGMGKSTFGTAVALNAALRGAGVYFVSLEMSGAQLAERMLAALAFDDGGEVLSYRRISEGVGLSDRDFDRLRKARQRLSSLALKIEQQPGLTLAQIAARARRRQTFMAKTGRPLRLIVIDHIGIIRPSDRYRNNRVMEVGEISVGLKVLAKDLGVAVMALSQLSRGVEGREDKRPSLSDLRDSGSIEQDADLVIGLYRESYYLERKANRTPEEENRLLDAQEELEAEILKQRQGPTGRVPLFCSIACNVVAEKRG